MALNRRTKSIFFFILFINIIVIFCLPVRALDGNTVAVKSNWLYVSAGDFADSTPHSWEKSIRFETGGEDLLEFENLGIVSISDEQIVYKARATFGCEVTGHTLVGVKNIYPNLNLAKENNYNYFAIIYEYLFSWSLATYSIKYDSIDYGSTTYYHSYSGTIPITVGIKELTCNAGNLVLNGKTFEVPDYKADVIQAEVTNLRDGQVGVYTDQFEDISGIESGSVTLVPKDDFSAEQQGIINFYNSYDLGWEAGKVIKGGTLQNSILDGSQSGSTFHNPNPADNEQFTFPLYAYIQPKVYEYVQYNTIRYAGIRYWTWGFWAGNIDTLVSPATKILPKRVVAVHVDNYYLHWDFRIDVEFYSTIPSTAKLSEAVLADPYLKKGDWVWDTSITGDINVQVPLVKDEIWDWLVNLFGEVGAILFIIAIIIIIIIGLYLIYRIFIKRRQGAKVTIINRK